MPGGSALNVEERRKCLKQMQERYLAAERSQKGELLSHLEVLTGLHRKSLVRLMRAASLERKGPYWFIQNVTEGLTVGSNDNVTEGGTVGAAKNVAERELCLADRH